MLVLAPSCKTLWGLFPTPQESRLPPGRCNAPVYTSLRLTKPVLAVTSTGKAALRPPPRAALVGRDRRRSPMPTEGGCSLDRLLGTLPGCSLVSRGTEILHLSGPRPSV